MADFAEYTVYLNKGPSNKVYMGAEENHGIFQLQQRGSPCALDNFDFRDTNDRNLQKLCKVIDIVAESVDFKDTNL